MCLCFMHEDNEPSMWLMPSKNIWKCEKCNKGGNNVNLVMKRLDLKYAAAVRWLAGNFGIDIDEDLHKKYQAPKGAQRLKRASASQIRVIREITSLWSVGPLDKSSVQKTQSLNPFYLTQFASTTSPFCQALVSNNILSHDQMLRAASKYHLGCTRDKGVIFWQINDHNQLLDGKIMFYKPDCHRDHNRHPSWVTSRLKHRRMLPEDFEASRCLFGLHLVTPGAAVAIVEAEKTAVICSELFPDYVWLATGGLSNLSSPRLAPLRNNKIIIFPDTDPTGETYQKWLDIAIKAQQDLNINIPVADMLELNATPEQKARKIDIADLLISNSKKL